ncbi:uncharacterized protein LOC121862337 isoform X2 [Homarus americanus]|nr:uncharacterized protein LOC121862337 isoform X2 [Homarus americanus]XP_042216509.1 uncharacterized protein LOC121862337 isoform X2 [Homarus americanus]
MFVTEACWVMRLMSALVLLPLLRADDHLILRYYVAMMRVVRPVMAHVLQLYTKNNDNFKELLFRLPGYSNTRYGKDFYESEQRQLNDKITSDNFDITLLFKLLQLICGLSPKGDAKWSTPGTLENKLRLLKNYRNDLAHDDLLLTPEDLQHRLSHIEELCREVLETSGCKCGSPITAEVRVMEEGLEEILTGSIDLWEPYRKALHNLQQQQCSTMVREGKKEIRDVAKKLRILNPFVWLLEDNFSHLDVGHIFVDVYIKGHENVNTCDLFTTTLPSGEYPDTLIIHGSPGIGKTSLMRYLIHDWLSTAPSVHGIDNIDLVLLVELRHVMSTTVQELLCEEILPMACRHLNFDDVIPTLKEVSTLWLLDGYDEATPSTRTLVRELFRKFPASKIIMTTRTDCANELLQIVGEAHLCHATYHMKGLSPGSWNLYAEKLFSVSIADESYRRASCKSFLQFMKDKERSMWEIFSVPLFVVLLVVLWLESPSAVTEATTITKLYDILISHIVNRMTRRYQITNLQLTESQVRDKINGFLDLLGNTFGENSQSYVYVLQDYQLKEIEIFCNGSGLPFKECMSPFFLVIVKATTMGTTEEYQPLHRTVQEFLAARAFCNAMISQDSDVLTIAGQWLVKHRKNKVQNLPEDEVMTRVYNKESFVICKLHEGSDLVFDDYEFVGDMFSENCFCPYVMGYNKNHEDEDEDLGEFERFFCRLYFQSLFTGSLVIRFICDLLKMNNAVTQSRAEQLIYVAICGQDKIRQYGLWLQLINVDSIFLEELKSQLSPYQWNPKPSELLQVGDLLQFVTPEALHVHLCDLRKFDNEQFTSALRIFSRFSVNISLDLKKFMLSMDRNDLDFAEVCIGILLEQGVSCRLTALGCPLSKESLKLLHSARHLEDLCVRVDTLEDLNTLADVTDSLQHLASLSVFLNFVYINNPLKNFPRFRLKQNIKPDRYIALAPSGLPGTGCFITYKTHLAAMSNMLIFKKQPHNCKRPTFPSCKLENKLGKICRSKRNKKLHKSTAAIIPFPDHLEELRTSGACEFFMRMWSLPSAHCQPLCAKTHLDPILCLDLCYHRPAKLPLWTEQEWLHHHQAIKYHQRSIKKLRSFYTILVKIIQECLKPVKQTTKKSFDPHIKLLCYEFSVKQLWKSLQVLNIYLLKVCELFMYEHKISIQQHRKLLTHVREPPSSLYSSSVQLAFINSFHLDAQMFSALVHQLCPNPLRLHMFDRFLDVKNALDIAQYVWHIGKSFPNLQALFIRELKSYTFLPSPIRHMVDTRGGRAITLIEKSAPKFIYDISVSV